MHLDEAGLFAFLQEAGIGWTYHAHPPLHTVAESRALRGELKGAHIKNMFLKARKGGLVLVSCLEDRQIRISDLEKVIGVRRLSFASAELLHAALGVLPGAVTPMALINDRAARDVDVVFDQQMLSCDVINCHPLHNRATIQLVTRDLLRFVELTGHASTVVDFDALEAQAAARALAVGERVAR